VSSGHEVPDAIKATAAGAIIVLVSNFIFAMLFAPEGTALPSAPADAKV
jgi:hypothetical protein